MAGRVSLNDLSFWSRSKLSCRLFIWIANMIKLRVINRHGDASNYLHVSHLQLGALLCECHPNLLQMDVKKGRPWSSVVKVWCDVWRHLWNKDKKWCFRSTYLFIVVAALQAITLKPMAPLTSCIATNNHSSCSMEMVSLVSLTVCYNLEGVQARDELAGIEEGSKNSFLHLHYKCTSMCIHEAFSLPDLQPEGWDIVKRNLGSQFRAKKTCHRSFQILPVPISWSTGYQKKQQELTHQTKHVSNFRRWLFCNDSMLTLSYFNQINK